MMEYLSPPFIAGLVAGASGVLIGHPLDTLKVQYQIRSIGAATTVTSTNLISFNVRHLYRGLLPPLLTSGTIQSINFSLYEYFKGEIRKRNTTHKMSVFLGGTISGTLISVVTTPIGLVKIRQQTARFSQQMPSIPQVIRSIYLHNGIRGFYKGYEPMLIMESIGRGIYLLIYETTKEYLFQVAHVYDTMQRDSQYSNLSTTSTSIQPSSSQSRQHVYELRVRMLSACAAGVLSWLLVYPFDVIKARLQADVANKRYHDVFDCIRQTYKEGGMKAFTRGLGFTLLRAAPVASVILPIYEFTKDHLEANIL